MNRIDMKFPRAGDSRNTLILVTFVLLATTAGAFWLIRPLDALLPAPVLALIGATVVTLLCVPLLWYRVRRQGDQTNVPVRQLAERIVSQTSESILIINKRGQLLALNPAAEKLFGYASTEVLNEPITKVLTESHLPEHKNLSHESVPVGTILGLAAHAKEMIGKRKNGETFAIELTVNSMTIDNEPVTVAFARDVSKRKQAQRYLAAHYAATCILAEAYSLAEVPPRILQSICEALRWEVGAYWQFDAKGGVLSCSDIYQAPFAALPKLPDAEPLTCLPGLGLAGRVFSTAKPVWANDLLQFKDGPCKALAGLLQLHGAFAFPVMVDQEVFGVMTFFNCRKLKPDQQLLEIMDELGKALGQFIARKRDEEMLQRSEERFRQLAENIREVFWIADPDRRQILYVSPAYADIWGRDCSSLYANPLTWLEAVHPEDRDRVREAVMPKRASDLVGYDVEFRVVRPDGSVRWVRDRGFPIPDASGHVYRLAGIADDVTERIQAKESLRQAEEQLRQAQKMEAIGQLAGGIAHDFNNLLTIINGYSEVLLGNLDSGGPDREFVEQILNAGERARALTGQLLTFARKEALQVQTLDLNVVVSQLEKMLRRMIGEDVELVTEVSTDRLQLQADPGQLDQLLMNLAVNARDAMAEGGKLTIATAQVDLNGEGGLMPTEVLPGPYVLLTVSDSGCGMSSQTKEHIFEPFFTTKGVGKGTGLGLATVYGIVKQNRGHIKVDSELGQGTTFRIYFPRMEKIASSLGDTRSQSPVSRGSETVLVAEDDEAVRTLTCRMLKESGYGVLEAGSGGEALRLCQRHEGGIALLLTDVIMPGMNGRQLAEQVVALRPKLKVLYTSGYTDQQIGRRGILEADTVLLPKPFSQVALARKVRDVLDCVGSA